ncbi:MCE family protein [Rhodococcus sp. NPDC003318]|uniref:MCE family protein n=1 Tax=Rhodococcus sp. NPDC003318 TaxID=3364503 RepID=UPI0036BAB5D6
MEPLSGRKKAGYAVRGLIAVVAGIVVAVVMVLRGSGSLEREPVVTVSIPASAGLITGEAPVRYTGVNVGHISGIDSGTESSVVSMSIDSASISLIPATVMARVVPRTFFGDIYIQLVDDGDESGAPSDPLADGDTITVDDGPDSVALYSIYTKLVDVLDRMQPQKLQTALTALGHALDGRGETIGRVVDRLSSVSATMTPAIEQFLEATPEFREVMTALDAATPDVIATLAAATAVSQDVSENSDSIGRMLAAMSGFASVASGFFTAHQEAVTTVIDSTGIILATTAANPEGLLGTLSGAQSFGATGARVFSTGKFNITAVPSFADPFPYTGADCPQYGAETGDYCSGGPPPAGSSPSSTAQGATAAAAVIDGDRESDALGLLESQVRGLPSTPGAGPNPATVMMLGPLVRGNEVTVR